jgi:asparagine synthase (glutamine-hydrolysing)
LAELLAIISHDPRAVVEPEAIDRLAADHAALRGPQPRRLDAGDGRVRVRVLGRPTPTWGVERDGAGWTAWAGSLQRRPATMTGPLSDLDGQFGLVRAASDGTVEVATDALGMKPLFLAVRDDRTFVSTSALVLARHLGATPSRLGLESFLRSGLQFGRATQWEGIERLRPAEARRFAAAGGGAGESTYELPTTDPEVGALSLGETAELCIERATAELAERYAGERPWIDLTGGFDSRLLSLLTARAGIEPIANTVGGPEDEDVRIARRVALARGWGWQRIAPPADWPERLPEELASAVAWGDGHLDAVPLAGVLAGHREKAAVEGLLLNGGGGEEFREHPWGHELWKAGRTTEVGYDRFIGWRLLLPIDLSPLRADPTAAVAAAMREELEARARPFASHLNTFQDDLLYAFKMTGHSGAYQAAAGAYLDLEVPFYLRPILFNVISVAPRYRRLHRLMREMMVRLDPAVAALPTETGGPAEPPRLGNLLRFADYGTRRGARFANRVRARLPERGGQDLPPPDERQIAAAALVARLRDEGRLDPASMRSAALYDPGRLDALFDRAAAHPSGVDWEAVGRIVTVEATLEAAGAGLG